MNVAPVLKSRLSPAILTRPTPRIARAATPPARSLATYTRRAPAASHTSCAVRFGFPSLISAPSSHCVWGTGTAASLKGRCFSGASAKMGSAPGLSAEEGTGRKKVFFFDIDNCLYPRSMRVHDRMAILIDEYFAKHLSLSQEEANRLHKEYYTNYGLAIEGLVRHHQIDPLDYNSKVDDALPLEEIIKPDVQLRHLLERFDKTKATMWLFTNAYVNHGKKVVRLLGVDDLFDGMTYCDYSTIPLVCKPREEMFRKAMKEAGVENVEDCFFVDDSYINCVGAKKLGWTAAHLVEEDLPAPSSPASQYQIQSLHELPSIFPQFFKPEA